VIGVCSIYIKCFTPPGFSPLTITRELNAMVDKTGVPAQVECFAFRPGFEGPRVEIGVLDNGPEVDDQLADHLFDPLATSKEEGLGLGLPICVSIVESHGGRVWLHSRDAGATEFRFSLPLDQSEVP
jgi:signal transduction histidine kinase